MHEHILIGYEMYQMIWTKLTKVIVNASVISMYLFYFY